MTQPYRSRELSVVTRVADHRRRPPWLQVLRDRRGQLAQRLPQNAHCYDPSYRRSHERQSSTALLFIGADGRVAALVCTDQASRLLRHWRKEALA